MRNTIKKWLEELPDGYRERALANEEADDCPNEDVESIYDAVYAGFVWSRTNEGHDFWLRVATYFKPKSPKYLSLPPLP